MAETYKPYIDTESNDFYPKHYKGFTKRSGHPLIKGNIKKSKINKIKSNPKFIKKAYEWAERNKAEDKITKWDLQNAERIGLLSGKKKWRNIGEVPSKAGGGEIVIGKHVDKDLL